MGVTTRSPVGTQLYGSDTLSGGYNPFNPPALFNPGVGTGDTTGPSASAVAGANDASGMQGGADSNGPGQAHSLALEFDGDTAVLSMGDGGAGSDTASGDVFEATIPCFARKARR